MDREVVKIDPADVAPARPPIQKIDPSEAIPLRGAPDSAAGSGGPEGSVFESRGQKLKRYGRTAAKVGVGAGLQVGGWDAHGGSLGTCSDRCGGAVGAAAPVAESPDGKGTW